MNKNIKKEVGNRDTLKSNLQNNVFKINTRYEPTMLSA